MKLPNIELAEVPRQKIESYLLSLTHRDGRHKATFFLGFGFRVDSWEELATAILNHARSHDVVKEEPSPFGLRYVIEGALESPDNRHPRVRSVWFIETGQTVPRFVTAYPLKGEQDD